MYACMYVCMHVCVHACMHIGAHAGVLSIDLSTPKVDWNAIGRSAATRRVDRWIVRAAQPCGSMSHRVAPCCTALQRVMRRCNRTRSYKDDDQPQLVERADLRVAQQLLDGRLRALHLQRAQRCDPAGKIGAEKTASPRASQATDILKCGDRAMPCRCAGQLRMHSAAAPWFRREAVSCHAG